MNTIPLEAQPFAIAAVILGIGAIVLSIRLSIVSRSHGILKQTCNDLEAHLLRAQRDLASARDDAAEWRQQMQKQFDAFRASSTGQLTMAEARFERLQGHFDDASKASAKTQLEQRTQLDALRGMCAELPYAKTRILELERGLGSAQTVASAAAAPHAEEHAPLDLSRGVCAELPLPTPFVAEIMPSPVAEPQAAPLLPLPVLADEPKLNGTNGHTISLAEIPAMPAFDDARLADLESQLAIAAQRNASLQRELITKRVRSGKTASMAKVKRGVRA